MRLTLPANTPTRLLDLLQRPDAPNAALAGAGAGNVENGAHFYAVSFVGPHGESAVGASSEVVTVADKTADGKVALTGIPIGPPGTTARKVYRTAAAGSQLKLQSTIANNTATTLTDNTADAGLGANAPTVSTSGLRGALGMYQDLIVGVDSESTNSAPVYVDMNNPNISDSNFGTKLEAGSSVRYAATDRQPIAAAHVWLFTTVAAQRFEINGQEI